MQIPIIVTILMCDDCGKEIRTDEDKLAFFGNELTKDRCLKCSEELIKNMSEVN